MGCAIKKYILNKSKVNTQVREQCLDIVQSTSNNSPVPYPSAGFTRSELYTSPPYAPYRVRPEGGKDVGRSCLDCGKASVKSISIDDLEREYQSFISEQERLNERLAAVNERANKRTACLSGIKGQAFNIKASQRIHTPRMKIFPFMIQIRNKEKIRGNNSSHKVHKKVIKGFSNKSRINFMKYLCKRTYKPQFEWEPTYPDDVMKDKSIQERQIYSSNVIHNLQRFIKRKYPDLWGTWRREWKPRQSGQIIGEICPHFHVTLGSVFGVNYIKDAIKDIILKFLELSGSQDPNRFNVAFHEDSFRELNDNRWRSYVSKYVSKTSEVAELPIGRSWGILGKPPISQGKEVPELNLMQYKVFHRIARKYMNTRQKKKIKGRRRMTESMKNAHWQGFIMMPEGEIEKLIKFCLTIK